MYSTLNTTAPTNHILLLLVSVCWPFCLPCLMSGKRGVKTNTDIFYRERNKLQHDISTLEIWKVISIYFKNHNWRGVVISTDRFYFNIFSLAKGHILTTEYSMQKKNTTENTRRFIIYIRLGKGSTLYAGVLGELGL